MKEKIRIIQEYDSLLAKEGKVNKTKFTVKTGISQSSLCTILAGKTRQLIENAIFRGKRLKGGKGSIHKPSR